MNELQINVELNEGSIITNIDELKKQLALRLSEYKNAVFTEDSKQVAKAELAGLRKLRKAVEERRKEIKEQHMIPYTVFEKEMKQLVAIIDEPIGLIDTQLKEMEDIRIKNRRADVRKLYDEIVSDGADYLPFDDIYVKTWDNVSTTMKSIKKDLEALVEKTVSDIMIIQDSGSDVLDEALEGYKRDRNLTKALTFMNTYEANRKKALEREEEKRRKEDERRRQEEIERAKDEERRKIKAIEEAKAEERRQAEIEMARRQKADIQPEDVFDGDEGMLPFEQPTTVTAFYRVVATPEELEQVEMAFTSIGIYFERRGA